MLAKEHIDDLLQSNGNVVATDGAKIGSIGQVYADDDNGQPTWVTVKTGLFGTSESFVPLAGAHSEGGDIVVPYTDDAMTRSEERLNVGAERQATGRLRLRKYVTTENVAQTVPVG
jgi:hypothetical protein